jgi:uncharacterized protein YbjT (DUF2867 family)
MISMDGRPVLVTGATGVVGSEVVRALLERGANVRALVRSPERVAHLPAAVERFAGDLRDPDSVRRAFQGVRSAFYVSPHESDEEVLAETFISLCERAGIRLVFAGVHLDAPSRAMRWLLRALMTRKFPHYRGKFAIGERARIARTDSVVLVPANFYQNDELFRDEILAGTFPAPLGLVGRVDVRDIGDAAARALLDPTIPSGAYNLVAPDAWSGAACAEVWSRVLGRAVRYTGDDFTALTTALGKRLHGRKREDFEHTYRLLGTLKMPPKPQQVAQATRLLARPPRSYAEYVRDTAASWIRGQERARLR